MLRFWPTFWWRNSKIYLVSLDVSQSYGPPRRVTRIALPVLCIQNRSLQQEESSIHNFKVSYEKLSYRSSERGKLYSLILDYSTLPGVTPEPPTMRISSMFRTPHGISYPIGLKEEQHNKKYAVSYHWLSFCCPVAKSLRNTLPETGHGSRTTQRVCYSLNEMFLCMFQRGCKRKWP
jgi:hypothetical protein